MGTSAARKMTKPLLQEIDRSAPSAVTPVPQPVDTPDDGLPPPTKLQVYYWAQVCGAVSACGTDGMTDGAWPPDLAPERRDLMLLVEHGLLVRRQRRWRLRRRWYERLCALKARAVSVPTFERLERPGLDAPTYAELEAYDRICRWLDARPKAHARLPFTGLAALEAEDDEHVSEEPIAELRAMRRLRLVRHTSRCEWALTSTWRARLDDLQKGISKALRHSVPPPALAAAAPASLCAGLDTWGLNWVVDTSSLPLRVRAELDHFQQMAQEAEQEVETRWVYDGVRLRMYQAGVRAKGATSGTSSGQGVSWSYILVNPSLRLLIRRTPLGGIVASARLGSECLWRRTPLAALNELDALVRRLWGKDRGTWRVSYAHLAHDVANTPLEAEQLERYVSRSRRRAIYDAAQAEVERLARELLAGAGASDAGDGDIERLDWDALPTYDWDEEYDAAEEEELLLADPFAEEGYAWDTRSSPAVRETRAALDEPVEKRSVAVHRWGRRLSGVVFSPGGPVSFVMYRKDWEARLKGKQHMQPLWKAAGWNGTDPVTRHEVRLTREPIRELRLAQAERAERSALDDPWEFLAQAADVWGTIVGRAEACPHAVDVAWIRRVVPREGETNRSRWDTDPSWRVVQQAPFTPTPRSARRLIRHKQRVHDVQKIDQQLLGLVKTREALLHTDPTGHDLSLACRDLLRALERETRRRGEDFGEAARVRRRDRGLLVPLVGKVLAFRPRPERGEVEAEQARVREVEETSWDRVIEDLPAVVDVGRSAARRGQRTARDGGTLAGMQGETSMGQMRTMTWLRWRSAELRLREAYAALEAAEIEGRAWRELDRLAQAFERASSRYGAAKAAHAQLGSAGEQGATPGEASIGRAEDSDG